MRQTIISLAASVMAIIVMFIPLAAFLLAADLSATSAGTNDSWQQGLVAAPVVFIVAVLLCSSIARWLVNNGWSSFKNFALGASAIGAALVIVLCLPAVLVGSSVGMFSLKSALMPVLLFAGTLFVSSMPAAAVWWLIAVRRVTLRSGGARKRAS